MAINFDSFKEFDDHRMVSFISDSKRKLKGFISIHRGNTVIPSFGATRFVSYNNSNEALRDALRLSKLMSYKSALAGLKYGGAKGVIILPQKAYSKTAILKAYCHSLNYLHGHFITGADVGLSGKDVRYMRKQSEFIVGVKVDPVKYTALGMLGALEVSLNEVFGSKSIKGRTFTIQGVGKIGGAMVELLYKEAKKIIVADVDKKRLTIIKKAFPKIILTTPQKIYTEKSDVFMPCALGHSLTSRTTAKLRSSIILGGANNQLANNTVGELLYKLGILYAPDYVVNAGGLISVVDEYETKNFDDARIKKRLRNIQVVLHSILKESQRSHRASNLVADQMAEKIFNSR
ncbi:MAG: hypothetical protein COT92_02470 [Candidatus Doudnabacteria bacterium CG10_big_fil_rev_8_21_14_0_10_42_18]|uniref:Glutamate/phenylalanine/leucine/valine/L-tryptophan dehydrogenase C-terminal domain-containing protein n=1 Tax=Candidatus Doudnabacteria bacterium CG10_big_fil_rev_8_21_14_0_10_42_18 TaxID=1974552 RepID=A0A2H0VAN3_9BACT|nr:MAG: hypothetical protein COT92_02470 [Candidatus Doudnabacteria bacterium CG10_big_fil_rev_8_21_14_0_10_42_18]